MFLNYQQSAEMGGVMQSFAFCVKMCFHYIRLKLDLCNTKGVR